MKQYLLTTILMSAVVFCFAERASACLCTEASGPVKKQIAGAKKAADIVFIGKIVSVRYSGEILYGKPFTKHAQFQITSSWKGPVSKFIEISTANICCICGVAFEEGETWLVYAHSDGNGGFSASSCSRTSRSIEDSKYLGKSRKVNKKS